MKRKANLRFMQKNLLNSYSLFPTINTPYF
nr:MAG TPA: hypothetical protein [Caudoviricetes sp.]